MSLRPWDTAGMRIVETRVHVNGVRTGHETVSWGQTLISSLPRQVEAATGFGQRTGTVVWWRPGISPFLPSPWSTKGGTLPTPGDRITVDALDGKGNTIRVFTGLIDTVESDGSGKVTSRIVDDTDHFNTTVRAQAITEIGIPWEDGKVRRLAPTNAWVVNEIGRQLGYYSTPPTPPGHVLDAPLQGTTYVYAEAPAHSNAQLITSHAHDGGNYADSYPPKWRDGGAGIALHDAYLHYAPYTGTGSAADQIRASILIHPRHTATVELEVHKTTGTWAWLRVDGGRRVTVGATSAGGGTTSHALFRLPASDDPIAVSAIFRGNRVTVATGAGQEADRPLHTPRQPVTKIILRAQTNAAVSGAQVSDPGATGGHIAVDWTPTMRTGYGWHADPQTVTPSIRDRVAREVLAEFADKLLTPVWLDADGRLRVESSSTLMAQPPAMTVLVKNTVSELGWGSAFTDLRDPVHVKWSDVETKMNYNSAAHSINLWQGPTQQSNSDTFAHLHDTIEIPHDEEWPGFNADVRVIDRPVRSAHFGIATEAELAEIARFNRGEGSWMGAMTDVDVPKKDDQGNYVYDGDGKLVYEQEERFNGSGVSSLNNYTFRQVTPWKYTLEMLLDDGNVTKVAEVQQIRRRFWGEALPLLRGPGWVRRKEATYTRSNANRNWTELTHDMGAWCTRSKTAQDFGNWLYGQLTTVRPKIYNATCRFDPRLDIGMVIRLDSLELHGAAVSALIVSIDQNPAGDTTRLEVRAIAAATSEQKTYGDFASAWSGDSYADVTAMWALIAGTYGQLELAPTRRN